MKTNLGPTNQIQITDFKYFVFFLWHRFIFGGRIQKNRIRIQRKRKYLPFNCFFKYINFILRSHLPQLLQTLFLVELEFSRSVNMSVDYFKTVDEESEEDLENDHRTRMVKKMYKNFFQRN